MRPHRISILSLSALTCMGCTVAVRPAYVPPPPPPTVAVTVGTPAPAEPAPPAEQPPPPEGPAAPAAEDTEAQADTYDDQDPTALQDFHPALDAHGQWVDDPVYGTIWVPNPAEVGPDFVPYMGGGHWVYGDDYLWVSDYDWGWAPFHYGRWVPLSSGGWGWIPGREYAPAWVEWRVGDDYIGWAPAAPLYIWRGGAVVTVGFVAPELRFGFVAHGDLFSPTPGRVVIRGERAEAIRARTHVYAEGGGGGAGHGHHGPPPTSLKIPPSKIAHATGHERGAEQARNFGHPSTAQRMGAHPPAKRVATAGGAARPGRAQARPEERKEPGKTAEREPAKGTEREPAKGTEREPAKGTEREPAKGTEREPAKGTEREPAKGTEHEPAKTASTEGHETGRPQGGTTERPTGSEASRPPATSHGPAAAPQAHPAPAPRSAPAKSAPAPKKK